MHFEIIGEIVKVETIAIGGRIRDIMRLQKQFGSGRWRKLKGIARVRIAGGAVRRAEVHWYEAWTRDMTKHSREPRFAVCVRNQECEDLEIRKVYRVLSDARADRDGYIRVVDESGDDYLYPESYFVFIRLPHEAQEAMAATV